MVTPHCRRMIEQVAVADFVALDYPVLDVRSPGEYEDSHIPTSFNLSLLDDKNRAEVGKTYKNQGQEAAIALGYQLVNPKRESILERANELGNEKTIGLYCARGGLRSAKMAEFLSGQGFHVHVLRGGYKAYRKYILGQIARFTNIVILAGHTGSGKTEVLRKLAELGAQVLDLESLAHHRGSAFGGLGQEKQPSTSQFQNGIFEVLRRFSPELPLWVENESVMIGRVCLPGELWANMSNAGGYELVLPMDERVRFILEGYGNFDAESLITCIRNLSRRLGDEDMRRLCQYVAGDDLEPVVRRLIAYYDKSYEFHRSRQDCQVFVKMPFEKVQPLEIAGFLLSCHSRKYTNNQ